jgi:hypothetical protein
MVPRRVSDRSRISGFVEGDRGSEGVGNRSTLVERERSPLLLIRRQC